MICVARSESVAAMQTMGDRLRTARINANYESAAKAAEALGVSASTYRAHENGQNDYSPEEAERYARKFGANAGYLLTGQASSASEIKSIAKATTDKQNYIVRLWELFGEAMKLEPGDLEQVVDLVDSRMRTLSRRPARQVRSKTDG